MKVNENFLFVLVHFIQNWLCRWAIWVSIALGNLIQLLKLVFLTLLVIWMKLKH